MTPVRSRTTSSEADTIAAGRELGGTLAAGDVVLLTGSLGAGKTAFARGLAEGLGCDTAGVSSPTFTIIQEYPGPIPLLHVDLYRLTPPEVDELGLDDLAAGAVLAVEWPDRWRTPLPGIAVTIAMTGLDTRKIAIATNNQQLTTNNSEEHGG